MWALAASNLVIFRRLYKTIHELLTQQLDETEDEIKKAEDVVQVESQPEDPTATHEELADLQVCLEYVGRTLNRVSGRCIARKILHRRLL